MNTKCDQLKRKIRKLWNNHDLVAQGIFKAVKNHTKTGAEAKKRRLFSRFLEIRKQIDKVAKKLKKCRK